MNTIMDLLHQTPIYNSNSKQQWCRVDPGEWPVVLLLLEELVDVRGYFSTSSIVAPNVHLK